MIPFRDPLAATHAPTPDQRTDRVRVCLASSAGGHLAQLRVIAATIPGSVAYVVTVASPDAVSSFPRNKMYYVNRIARNPAALVLNCIQSLAIFVRERPSGIITTGAGEALPTVVLGAATGVPVLFVESVARVDRPSLFGKWASRFASMTVFQWAHLTQHYPRGTLASPMIKPPIGPYALPGKPSIIILTGTHTRGFERLLIAIDNLLATGRLHAKVFAQIGHSSYVPKSYPYERFLEHDKLVERIRAADLVVTHDGSGSIADGLRAGRRVIVVPRNPERREVTYRSTSELARHLSELGWITLVEDPLQLPESLESRGSATPILPDPGLPEVVEIVGRFLNTLPPRRYLRRRHADGGTHTRNSPDEARVQP